jgi:hypothetical protein
MWGISIRAFFRTPINFTKSYLPLRKKNGMKHWILLFVVGMLLGSCYTSNDPAADTPNAADITGSVFLYDEGVNRVANDGMTVTVENSNPVKSALTDAEGKFVIKDVPLGNHDLVFTKNGYGTFKLFDVVHAIDNSPTVITSIPSLGKVSTTQVTAISASVAANVVTVEATTSPAGSMASTRYVRFFLHTSANVSDVFHSVYLPTFVSRINPYVYARVYGDSYWSNQYDDPGLDRRVFPNLNDKAAAAVSFVVP